MDLDRFIPRFSKKFTIIAKRKERKSTFAWGSSWLLHYPLPLNHLLRWSNNQYGIKEITEGLNQASLKSVTKKKAFPRGSSPKATAQDLQPKKEDQGDFESQAYSPIRAASGGWDRSSGNAAPPEQYPQAIAEA